MNPTTHLTARNALAFLAIVIAPLVLGGCKKPESANPAITEQAAKIAAASAPEARGVLFGKKFALLGVAAKPANAGMAFELAWKSLAKQRLEALVPVHVVDADGKILAQADYRQRPEHGEVGEGAIWVDVVTVPYQSLQGATALGIIILEADDRALAVDRGPRDFGGNRLLVPLAADMPVKPAAFQGSLDVADCDRLVGWAANKDQAKEVIEVEFYEGERLIAQVAADAPRPDLVSGGFGDGKHGFTLATPAQLKDGRPHTISARIAGTRFELRNSPATITCPKK